MPTREALEELIGTQALNTELKPALLACFTGRESRRWTVMELYERLNNLGIRCSKPAVLGALGELELEISLCPWLPWNLVEHGTEWTLLPKSDILSLLSGIRRLPDFFCRLPDRRAKGGTLGGDRSSAQRRGLKDQDR